MVATAAVALFASPAAAQTSAAAAEWGTQGRDCAAPAEGASAWRDRTQPPECRARFVLNEFKSLDEKLRFLSPPPQGDASDVRDVLAGLGLPRINGSDGPAGLSRGPAATALPSPIAVAASFDPQVATTYGSVMAREFRAAGLGSVLGPAFDIARNWKFGRLSESMGEDPFLTAAMAGAEVRALTDGGVLSVMKHYAVYAQEAGRVGDQPSGSAPTVDNIVSERAIREVYLPGFEAAVKQGGAGGVMCAFPKINGVYACEHPLLYDILKREWGFDGYVGPDFPSAQRSVTRAVIAGLDSGTFTPAATSAALGREKPLRQAVLDGEVPEARIDDMILRRLIPFFRIGLFDDPPGERQGDDVSTPENRAAAADILTAGTVLLKNERGILPFGPRVRSVAVVGLQATEQATVVEQGSPYVRPVHLEPALGSIRQRAGTAVRVTHAAGTLGLGPLSPIEPSTVTAADGRIGFTAEFFANRDLDFSQPPIARQVVSDPSLSASPDIAGLPDGNGWSVRYSGRFIPKVTGVHRFTLHGSGTARLIVDGVERGFELADFGNAAFVNVPLRAGRPAEIRIEYTPRSALRPQRIEQFGMEMGLTLRFGHAPPDNLIAEAVRAARAADVAVVFAGERVGEGMDRHYLALQGDQDALIEAVAAANPNTIVVLSTGGPVAMPWLGKVRAVLETWLPGDAFGPAIAGMLFGDREPGGRLPVTFPADETQGPGTRRHQFPGLYNPATGKLDTAYFDEGVFVGYRYYLAHDQTPLFPFGHGLGYGEVRIEVEGIVAPPSGGNAVRLRLSNDGGRPATAVPQLYLQLPESAGEQPWELQGFAKATLAPGETRVIEIPIPSDAYRFWDEQAPGWRNANGVYPIAIGRSASDIVWRGQHIVILSR